MLQKTEKSPNSIRQGLEEMRNQISLLADALDQKSNEKLWGMGELCSSTSAELRDILEINEVPIDYKVAVIGRFKAGKSSFVNELLNKKLAGEDTNPETAAITSFIFGSNVRAKIKLISSEDWAALQSVYKKDVNDPEAHRVKKWHGFQSGSHSKSEDRFESFDLRKLEDTLVKSGGNEIVIEPDAGNNEDETRKSEAAFRRKIKDFTSGSKPHHCLVEGIQIETPAPILEQGVTLIDTPGLDDTERFRVQLTEQVVADVDCALFLTKSGASYGQSEKEFLLTLLRKGTLKQLIFVVTQVDHTYDQHVRNAEDNDEDPATISVRIAQEEARIRGELLATLEELTKGVEGAALSKYREQLENVEIVFTSAANHRDWQKRRAVQHPISENDPGGLFVAQEKLLNILSAHSRVAVASLRIQNGMHASLDRMISNLEKRCATIKNLKSKKEAERKLSIFREEFGEACNEFKKLITDDRAILAENLAARNEMRRLAVEKVALSARDVLSNYETEDASKHWRSRRNERWGFLNQIQTRVANNVFPTIGNELQKSEEHFEKFLTRFKEHLVALSVKAEKLCDQLGIAEDFEMDLSTDLEVFLGRALEDAHEIVAEEENRITSMLDQFVNHEIEGRLADARGQVSEVYGRGTTVAQTVTVRNFYGKVKSILGEALSFHVNGRFKDFQAHLEEVSASLPKDAIREVHAQIERASEDIKSAAEANLSNDRDAYLSIADDVMTIVKSGANDIDNVIDGQVCALEAPPKLKKTILEKDMCQAPLEHGPINSEEEVIRAAAVNLKDRLILKNGERRWSYKRIFKVDYLKDATVAWVTDPYLAKRHQQRNLKELVATLLRTSKLKTLHVITSSTDLATETTFRESFVKLEREIYEQSGLTLNLQISTDLHDRFVVLDNGYVWKLGRGLDIYKPATGVASADQALRSVRECEIDIFSTP